VNGTFEVGRRKYVMWAEKGVHAAWWMDANIEFHLQLYFYAGVFLPGAWCVPGMVFVLRYGIAASAPFVCKKLTSLADGSQPFRGEAHLMGERVLKTLQGGE
jgi:hypothetical protein